MYVYERANVDSPWTEAKNLNTSVSRVSTYFRSNVLLGDELFVGASHDDETYRAGAVYLGHITRCP